MNKTYLPFEQAREFIRGLKIQNQREWWQYRKIRNKNIPGSPWIVYKNSGWCGLKNWLGTEFLSYEQIKEYVKKLKISGRKGWFEYYSSHPEIKGKISLDLSQYYKNKEWESWSKCLNTPPISSRKYKINKDFFKTQSHNMAYVFGLWWADGYMSFSGRSCTWGISLAYKDTYLLKKVMKVMGANYNLYDNGKGCVSMQLTSKPITEDIIKIGGRVNKNKGSYFPKIGKKYLPDFIRGLFDGDGSISYCKPRKKGVKGRYYASITSGNKKFITQISKYLYTCGIICKIQEYEPRKFVIRGIEYCGKRKYYILNILMGGRGGYGLIRFADLMYKNAGLKMERKYKKFSCARNLWNKNFGTKK